MTQAQVNNRAQARIGELVRQMKRAVYSRQLRHLQTAIEQLEPAERKIFDGHLQGAPVDSHETDQAKANAAFEANFFAFTATIKELSDRLKGNVEAKSLGLNKGGAR